MGGGTCDESGALLLAALVAMVVIGNVFPDDLQSDIDDLPNIEAGVDFINELNEWHE